jgi:hypothetical protein
VLNTVYHDVHGDLPIHECRPTLESFQEVLHAGLPEVELGFQWNNCLVLQCGIGWNGIVEDLIAP